MDSAFTLTPDTSKTDLITTAMIATATTITRMNIGGTAGTGTIIGTITIGIMTGTTTGIDASCFFSAIIDFLVNHRKNGLIGRIYPEAVPAAFNVIVGPATDAQSNANHYSDSSIRRNNESKTTIRP